MKKKKNVRIDGMKIAVTVKGDCLGDVLNRAVKKFTAFVAPYFEEGTTLSYGVTRMAEDGKDTWRVEIAFAVNRAEPEAPTSPPPETFKQYISQEKPTR